jgi:hypothetical protein
MEVVLSCSRICPLGFSPERAFLYALTVISATESTGADRSDEAASQSTVEDRIHDLAQRLLT